ncbi:MAG: hypothetical protein DME54_08725 [Verrucomicrobia bacterium]|nr:MAG: hypothetical protein DMF09_02525 [Verrucomicrobiota bacterium]PYJ91437.1 MAG: hypothetical protein DME62_15475 [Verrucomicrobiota bacterium]PYK34347.1 MAG: hypothetical protein DME54_08725 [Verrucomicrobiota bacterium]PYL19784.1 MAG: hypothetical protein DMF41_08755 [Verrucomicrobiota bacterium]
MYFSRRDGVVSPSLWAQIERTMIDFLAYPGTRQWWETRKHWYTEDFLPASWMKLSQKAVSPKRTQPMI